MMLFLKDVYGDLDVFKKKKKFPKFFFFHKSDNFLAKREPYILENKLFQLFFSICFALK